MSELNYVCPTCKTALVQCIVVEQSFLHCQKCAAMTPLIKGFALFNETDIAGQHLQMRVDTLNQKFSDMLRYQQYIEAKQQRNILEMYAAFQPFNESSRAIYPFIDRLQQQLQPGDLIIDTWARTGWSTLLLAALFPEQHIVGIWEKDNSVLGYAGYGHWFSSERRPDNVTIIFLAPEQNLPFNDQCASLIHGHDVLHRRRLPNYIDDLLRVAKPDATVLLPHVHLSNSEPEPFFERGGCYRHGRDYHHYLEQKLQHNSRTSIVLSELQLFEQQRPLQLIGAENGNDYNGMIVIAENKLFNNPLTEKWLNQPNEQARIISNPLLQVCPLTGCIYLNQSNLAGELDDLLLRHPVYQRRLEKTVDITLNKQHIKLLSYADNGDSIFDIACKLATTVDSLTPALLELAKAEVITLLPVSTLAVELQNFHSNQHNILDTSFSACWLRLLLKHPNKTVAIVDGEALTATELTQLIDGWRRLLRRRIDLTALHVNTKNTMVLPLVMACWLEERTVSSNLAMSDNELVLISTEENLPSTTISLCEESYNFYWDMLEPFIEENSLPTPDIDINTPALTVGDIPWPQWLSAMMSVL